MKIVKEIVPWWLKISAKIVLSRLPIPYAYWKRLGLFEHGAMNRSQWALETFLGHAHSADALNSECVVPQLRSQGKDYTVLELGPGDSLFTAVIARSLGASKTWLVDSGSFAMMGMEPYVELIDSLRKQGLTVALESSPQTLMELLKECRAQYLTDGVRSLSKVPSNAIDYCFSNAVLEHIPKGDFEVFVPELHRVMKPEGVSIHRVDLKDHLGGNLNNLRFTDTTWEGNLFRKSGFYTNRIRFGEMVNMFERVGFHCEFPRVVRWGALPTPKAKLDEKFRYLSDDNLLVSGFDIVLRRKG